MLTLKCLLWDIYTINLEGKQSLKHQEDLVEVGEAKNIGFIVELRENFTNDRIENSNNFFLTLRVRV